MPRKKDEKLHATRRQQILDAAKECFITRGFHQTSMRQILDASGISAGGAYNYFASKADIVKYLVDEERADIELLEKQLKSNKDSLAGVAQLVADMIHYSTYEDAVLAVEIHAEACRSADIGRLTSEANEQIKNLILDAISAGRKDGSITNEYTATEMTEWVIALFEGYFGQIAADPGLQPKKLAKIAKRSVLRILASTT